MNSYELSRGFVDFSFENPSKVKPNHYALYFFAIEHCNRLGWKKEFGLPTTMAMEAIGIKSYNTYINTFNELINFGFFKSIERSKNQYSSNIIELSYFNKALDKALDKAFIKHATKQEESTEQSIDSIIKQITNKQLNKEQQTILKEFTSSFLMEDEDVKKPKTNTNEIDFDKLLELINSSQKRTGKQKLTVINTTTRNKFKARLKDGYTKENIKNAILNAAEDTHHKDNNYKWLKPEYFSRATTLDMHGFKTTASKINISTEEYSKNQYEN